MMDERITTADGKQILLNARVNTENVENVQQYQYEVLPITDELRKTLFNLFFGERASKAVYDQRNDVWELHNSEAIGDYYLYEHTMAMAGESVPGEEIFTLQYRDVNLYPFDDNLLSTSEECGVSTPLEDVISLCSTITDAIAPQSNYTADTVLPYGNQGRHPYYKIFFRRTVDLSLSSGNIYGFVGSNGSGKTMLFRALSGLISITSGEITLDTKTLKKDFMVLPNLGILLENISLYSNLTGYENLRYLAQFNQKASNEDIELALRQVGLDPYDKRKYGKYSLGMKQRLAIAQALMEKPDILMLDEPTNALDQDSIENVRKLIKQEKERGVLILLASHNKDDIQLLADYIYTIDNGAIVDEREKTI